VDVEAVPGAPRSVALVGRYFNTTAATPYLFYDDGVERYGLLNAPDFQLRLDNLLATTFEFASPTLLYGTVGNNIVAVDVGATALHASASATAGLTPGALHVGAETIVDGAGVVMRRSDLTRQGTLGVSGVSTLSADGRVAYMATALAPAAGFGQNAFRISCFDLATLTLKSVVNFTAAVPATVTLGLVRQLSLWGSSGMVMRVDAGLLLLRGGIPELEACR
jgi:hypothetical protein